MAAAEPSWWASTQNLSFGPLEARRKPQECFDFEPPPEALPEGWVMIGPGLRRFAGADVAAAPAPAAQVSHSVNSRSDLAAVVDDEAFEQRARAAMRKAEADADNEAHYAHMMHAAQTAAHAQTAARDDTFRKDVRQLQRRFVPPQAKRVHVQRYRDIPETQIDLQPALVLKQADPEQHTHAAPTPHPAPPRARAARRTVRAPP